MVLCVLQLSAHHQTNNALRITQHQGGYPTTEAYVVPPDYPTYVRDDGYSPYSQSCGSSGQSQGMASPYEQQLALQGGQQKLQRFDSEGSYQQQMAPPHNNMMVGPGRQRSAAEAAAMWNWQQQEETKPPGVDTKPTDVPTGAPATQMGFGGAPPEV